MNRLTILAFALASIIAFSPAAAAQSGETYGSRPGDERTQVDGAPCFEAVAALDGTTCVVLYGHIFDLLNAVPINVQRVPDDFRDISSGFSGTPQYEPFWNFNQFTLYSSPGFVEYPANSNDRPRLHPERGLTSNVEIAKDVDILGYWYLSADFDEFSTIGQGDQPVDPHVGVMPCVTLRMVLQTGRHFGQGDVLAEGRTTKTIVSSSQGADGLPIDGQTHACPSGEGTISSGKVSEFVVNLGKATADIPKDKGFIVYVEWWQHKPGNPDRPEGFVQHNWNVHTGSDYMSRVLVPIKNPVRVEKVRPQFFDSKLYVHGVLNSPWGSYDVDPTSIKVEIVDESGALIPSPSMEKPILRYSVDHDGHFKPVNATFAWDYKADGVGPGDYKVRLVAKNWQHTGDASKEASIQISEDVSKSVATDSDGDSLVGDRTVTGVTEEGPVGFLAPTLVMLALVALVGFRRRH